LPGANRLPALDFDARGASAALDLDARGDDFFQGINGDYSEAVLRSVKHAYTMDETGYATLHHVAAPADTIPIYPSGTSLRWTSDERRRVHATLGASRP